jgi:hypothetical protein
MGSSGRCCGRSTAVPRPDTRVRQCSGLTPDALLRVGTALGGGGSAIDNGAMRAHATKLPLSLDPLMAEAKRRMRSRRRLAGVVALALVAAAVWLAIGPPSHRSSSASSPAALTNLTLLVANEFGGQLRFHLTCHPASGNLPHPASACAAIAARPSLITRPKPFNCWGPSLEFTILGRMQSKPVNTKLATCWSTQMPLIKALALSIPRG